MNKNMSAQASLFSHIKNTDELIAAIEANANKSCKHFNWSFCISKNKAGQLNANILFVGMAYTGKVLYYSDCSDSIDHALFLLDGFLNNLK